MPYFVIPVRISEAMLRIYDAKSLLLCVSNFCIMRAALSR